MTVKIPLRVRGLDLRDIEAYDRIHPDLVELSWEANGAVSFAVVYCDDPSAVAVAEAADWAKRISKLMPGVYAPEVYDELVSVSDVAARAGVAAEAVRLWAAGKRRASLRPFPSPRQVVGSGSGGKTMNLYAWRDVASWIREAIGTDPDEGIDYLTDGQLADLNAELADMAAATAWHPIDSFSLETERVIADVQQLCAKKMRIGPVGTSPVRADETAPAAHKLKLAVGFQ